VRRCPAAGTRLARLSKRPLVPRSRSPPKHGRRARCRTPAAAAAQPPLLTVSHITLPTPPADDATDILEAANQVQLNDRRDAQQQKVDADFFNRFDDDADESDMRPPSA
jgi:hypothetical protein